MAKGLDEGNHLEAIGARVRNDLCYVRLAICVVRGDIPDVSSEGKHVLVLYEDSRRSRRGEEGKEVLEVSQLWRGAFQVQMDDATSRYVSGSTGIEEAYRKTRFKFSLHVLRLSSVLKDLSPYLVPSGLVSGKSESGIGSILDMSTSLPPSAESTLLLLGMKLT